MLLFYLACFYCLYTPEKVFLIVIFLNKLRFPENLTTSHDVANYKNILKHFLNSKFVSICAFKPPKSFY